MITPSLNVSRVNTVPNEPKEAEVKDDVAGLQLPDCTLVTINEVPPFWK
jgi:hypothetical protein